MGFIQRGTPEGIGIRPTGEFADTEIPVIAVEAPRARERRRLNLWRLGGLAGGLLYSVAFWVLAFHGGRAVIAWIAPETPAVLASSQNLP